MLMRMETYLGADVLVVSQKFGPMYNCIGVIRCIAFLPSFVQMG